MFQRMLRVVGIEFYKLRHRRVAYVLVAFMLLIVIGQALGTAHEVHTQRDRTRELNGYVVFATAGDTGLFVASLLLLLYASASFAGETSLGTMKGLLIRPVTRLEFLLGKALALALMALGLGAGVLAAAAACGAVLSDYGSVVQITHNERTTGLLVTEAEDGADPEVRRLADLRRVGFTGHWDAAFAALRIDRVREGSLAEQRNVQKGDIVTHVAVERSDPARLESVEHWSSWVSRLEEGATVTLTLDAPLVTENRDYPESYILGQAARALLMVPLPLVAVVCFGLLGSALVENLGLSVGGTLLSFLTVRFVLGALIVGALRLATGRPVFLSNVERWFFTTWLSAPMAKLHGTATATANMQIVDRDIRQALLVGAATSLACVAFALWKFRRKDILG